MTVAFSALQDEITRPFEMRVIASVPAKLLSSSMRHVHNALCAVRGEKVFRGRIAVLSRDIDRVMGYPCDGSERAMLNDYDAKLSEKVDQYVASVGDLRSSLTRVFAHDDGRHYWVLRNMPGLPQEEREDIGTKSIQTVGLMLAISVGYNALLWRALQSTKLAFVDDRACDAASQAKSFVLEASSIDADMVRKHVVQQARSMGISRFVKDFH